MNLVPSLRWVQTNGNLPETVAVNVTVVNTVLHGLLKITNTGDNASALRATHRGCSSEFKIFWKTKKSHKGKIEKIREVRVLSKRTETYKAHFFILEKSQKII